MIIAEIVYVSFLMLVMDFSIIVFGNQIDQMFVFNLPKVWISLNILGSYFLCHDSHLRWQHPLYLPSLNISDLFNHGPLFATVKRKRTGRFWNDRRCRRWRINNGIYQVLDEPFYSHYHNLLHRLLHPGFEFSSWNIRCLIRINHLIYNSNCYALESIRRSINCQTNWICSTVIYSFCGNDYRHLSINQFNVKKILMIYLL
jgi:hypothetical protein